MSGTGGRKPDTQQDTNVQPTEEPVEAIVKEELEAAKPLRKTIKGPPSLLPKRNNIPDPNKS